MTGVHVGHISMAKNTWPSTSGVHGEHTESLTKRLLAEERGTPRQKKQQLTSSKSRTHYYLLILYKVHYVMRGIQTHIFSCNVDVNVNVTTISYDHGHDYSNKGECTLFM